MPKKIIALVGPSGVGKNFAKQALKEKFPHYSELTVLTTRTRRPSDGKDRRTDIPTHDFIKLMEQQAIIGAQQPFGSSGDWYGFSKKQIDQLLKKQSYILTEIHIDNVPLFKKLYPEQLFLIGLIADNEYLRHNLQLRQSEDKKAMASRLKKAKTETQKIKKLKKNKQIDALVEIGWHNRENMREIITTLVGKQLMGDQETKLNFK